MTTCAQDQIGTEQSLVLRADRKGVATLRLNRPDKRNALNVEIFIELDRHLTNLERQQDDIGIVVLTAAGPVFSAGADVRSQSRPPAKNFQTQTISRLANLPQIVVAAIHGPCYAGGLELVLAADILVASESARFADTHGAFALAPGWGMSQRLPRRIGGARAMEMMLLGRAYDGRAAERMGLVNFCYGDADWESSVIVLVEELRRQSWHSLRAYKNLLRETRDLPLTGGLAFEAAYNPGAGPDFKLRRDARLLK